MTPSQFKPHTFHDSTSLLFEIEHGIHEQTYANLYVSPFGSNSNSGLSANEPRKTINIALSKSLGPYGQQDQTIFLDFGEFKFSNHAAYYPLGMPGYVHLAGASTNLTILDAENKTRVIRVYENNSPVITDLTITGGIANYYGGGIYCYGSNMVLKDVAVTNNVATSPTPNGSSRGGGIYCYESDMILQNVFISENSARSGGGIYCENSAPVLKNVAVINNIASHQGGGISLSTESNPFIINSTIANNLIEQSDEGGGIYCYGSNPTLTNTIMWNNYPNEIECSTYYPDYPFCHITISMSDIKNGQDGIITNGVGTVSWQEGNIDADPLFTDIRGISIQPFQRITLY